MLRTGALSAVIVVVFLFIVSLFAGSLPFSIGGPSSSEGGARVGDHWHARYEVSVCGDILPPFPESSGAIHSHGDGDGQIHNHPGRSSEAGPNANLGRFFDSVGGKLTDTILSLPLARTYTNGDQCPDGQPGRLSATVNGVEVAEPSLYIVRDEDVILISFSGP